MSQTNTNRIKIANPPLEDELRTYLTSDIAAAGTDLPVLATTGFVITGADDYYNIIGEYGIEKTEIKLIDAGDASTDATGFKVAALTFSHEASDPVTFMRYNQIKVYGMATTGATKNLVATIDIDCSQQYTEYTYSGSTYSYFVTTYYNSTDDEESAYSEEIASTSFTRLSCKRIIESGLRKAMTKIDQSPAGELNWTNCLEIVEDGIDEILARKRKWPFLHTIATSATTVSGTDYIIKPTDCCYFQFLIINDYKLQWISQLRYNELTETDSTVESGAPTHFTEKNNKHYLYPTPDAAYEVKQEYYKVPATITTLTTEVDRVFVPVLIYFCGSQFAAIRGNEKKSAELYRKFEKNLELQCIEFSGPMQSGDATEIERTAWEEDWEV